MRSIPSLRSRLALLVTVCLLPASLIAVVLLYYDYSQGREKLVGNSIATARAVASLVDKDFASMEAMLRALATSPSLTAQDLPAFYRQAESVLVGHAANNIVLSDPDGRQLLNTLRPYGAPLPQTGSASSLRLLANTEGPVISQLSTGAVARRPVITVAIPVRRDGRHLYNLSAGILPEQFARLLDQQQLPPDWITAIIDSGGTIVVRSHEMQRFAGHRATQPLLDAMAMDSEGVFDGATSEGIPVLAVFSRSGSSNWSVAIGIPASSLTGKLRLTIAWLALAIVLLFAGSLGLAWIIGGRVARSIRALSGPALALGEGRKVDVPPLALREADEVGKALMRASQMLGDAQHKATHDTLTGLANRSLFGEVVNRQLSLCARNGTPLALLYIDLDGFKAVNDIHGHAGGDQLLRETARRLDGGIRESDLAARLGGDEFAVVLIGASAPQALAVAGKLLNALSEPFPLGASKVAIAASIGVACYPECGSSSEELLRAADQAMYGAKAAGKHRVVAAAPADAVSRLPARMR